MLISRIRDGPVNVETVAALMAKINNRCGDGAVRLVVVASADRSLVVKRQDWEDLRQLQLIMAELFSEISPDQLARLLKSEGLEGV